MGSLTIRTLAERGVRVLGFDRFAPPHAMGSSHGETRIIREAYFEDPRYVPLVQRAYERWADLEQQTGTRLFQQTGGLMLGYPDGALISGARLSAELHRLPHDLLDAAAVRRRFPAFRPEDDMVGVWEPRAGMLFPERCIAAALSVAQAAGATVHTGETLLGFDATDAGVTVRTDAGHYEARTLVLSVGAWTRDVLADLALPLVVQRNLLFWFDPERAPAQFAPRRFRSSLPITRTRRPGMASLTWARGSSSRGITTATTCIRTRSSARWPRRRSTASARFSRATCRTPTARSVRRRPVCIRMRRMNTF